MRKEMFEHNPDAGPHGSLVEHPAFGLTAALGFGRIFQNYPGLLPK